MPLSERPGKESLGWVCGRGGGGSVCSTGFFATNFGGIYWCTVQYYTVFVLWSGGNWPQQGHERDCRYGNCKCVPPRAFMTKPSTISAHYSLIYDFHVLIRPRTVTDAPGPWIALDSDLPNLVKYGICRQRAEKRSMNNANPQRMRSLTSSPAYQEPYPVPHKCGMHVKPGTCADASSS